MLTTSLLIQANKLNLKDERLISQSVPVQVIEYVGSKFLDCYASPSLFQVLENLVKPRGHFEYCHNSREPVWGRNHFRDYTG